MSEFIENKIIEWSDISARETNLRLDYLEKKLFSGYEISLPPNPNFWTRITGWINNAKGDKDLEIELFNCLNSIFFVGESEFLELYRQAYNGPIARWLIDKEQITFSDTDAHQKLINAAGKTWFCPISDSLRINQFYHVNNVHGGADIRADWRTLVTLGDENSIRKYITDNNFQYVVLLEDFVGGGSQMWTAVQFAAKFSDIASILVVPLIICPLGANNLRAPCAQIGVEFSPVLLLSEDAFISEDSKPDEIDSISKLRSLAYSTFHDVTNGQLSGERDSGGVLEKPYYPLGWNKTGGLIVMHTNTPDNTLPMFHWSSGSWNPIFPRHSRN